jgi:hypothetical protein
LELAVCWRIPRLQLAERGLVRHAVELAMSGEDIGRLTEISRSRTERASWVERAQMLLAYRENPSFFAVGESQHPPDFG